jgi:hypothetical protein
MYLPSVFIRYIFVTVKKLPTTLYIKKIVIPLKSLIPFLVCWLLASVQISAQQVWPGDVNNDGIVTNTDVIYWAYAKDAAGPPRADADSSWAAQALPDSLLWSEYYPDSLNFAYADCNGDGIVDHLDSIIIRNNYWFKRDSVSFEIYEEGIPLQDSPLYFNVSDTLIGNNEEKLIGVGMGSVNIPTDSVYAIAFSIKLPIELTDNGINDNIYDFTTPVSGWLNSVDEEIHDFVLVDSISGLASISLFKEFPGSHSSGWGDIFQFNLIVEELVFISVDLEIDSARYFDHNLNVHPLIGETLRLHHPDSLNNSQGGQPGVSQSGVDLYPNPSNGTIQVVVQEGTADPIGSIEVYSLTGEPVMELQMDQPSEKAEIEMNDQPAGFYFIRVQTQNGQVIKPLILSPQGASPGQF